MEELPATNWNNRELHKIHVKNPEQFSFAVFGESQRSKFVFENTLKLIDHDPSISFAISLGDMVSRGKIEKYEYVIREVEKNLGVPLLTTMGEGELHSRGTGLYADIFGPDSYSLEIGGSYLLILNDSDDRSIETAVQSGWVEKRLKDAQAYEVRLVFMNKPLYDPTGEKPRDCLGSKIGDRLNQLFSQYNVTHIFTAGLRGHYKGQWQGVPFSITGGGGIKLDQEDEEHFFNHFLKVTIADGHVNVFVKKTPPPDFPLLDHLVYNIIQVQMFVHTHLLVIALFGFFVIMGWFIYHSADKKRNRQIYENGFYHATQND